jgi:ATP-binding cassette subfamily B protein
MTSEPNGAIFFAPRGIGLRATLPRRMTESPPTDSWSRAPRTLRWFLRSLLLRLGRYRLQCAAMVGALLVDVAFETLLPLSLKFLIDDAILPKRLNVLVGLLAALAIGGILVAAVQVGRDYLYADLGARVLTDLRQDMFAHLQKLSLGFYSATPSGEITTRFSADLASVENVITLALPSSLMSAFNVLASATVLVLLEWRLAVVAAVGVLLCAIGPRLLADRAARGSHALKAGQAALTTMLQEDLNAQPVVKAFGLGRILEPRFRSATEQLRRTSLRANFLTYLMERTPNIGLMIFNLLVISVGGYLAFRGRLSIGSLVTFQLLLMNLSSAVYGITWAIPHFVQGAAGMQRIDEILSERVEVDDAPDAAWLPRLRHSIRFDAVTFGYADRPSHIEGLDFEIAAGGITALVGASGSGKSTALNLLLRFYDPRSGAVRFDGRNVRDVTQESLHAQMGVVFQESFLFDTTVRENIRYGKLDATSAEVEYAARLAEVHDAVLALPKGYDTMVGERGARLSGGQRQRVAIARALLRNPALLLLDEATSALDPAAEASINETIERLRIGGERTIVTVTHRLAAARTADHIVVFADGRVAERGTHAELIAARGIYRELWEKQSGFSVSADGDRAAVDVDRLRAVPILSGLEPALLAELTQYFGTEHYAAGRDVIQQGDYGDRFYIIARGRVLVTKTGEDGASTDVATLTDGDFFGEIALLRNERRNATVRALTPSVLLSLSGSQFMRLIARAPAMRERVHQTLITRGVQ